MEYTQEYSADRGYIIVKCLVCDICCDTMEQFSIHQKSSKHIKKAGKLGFTCSIMSSSVSTESSRTSISESSMSSWNCRICNVNCNTKDQLEKHFTGQSHLKKSLKNEYKDWTTADIPQSLPCSSNSQYVQSKPAYMDSPVPQNVTSLPVNVESANHDLSLSIIDLLRPEISGNFVICKLCNVRSNTEEQYQLHCGSTKHTKKMSALNLPDSHEPDGNSSAQIGDNEVKLCDICQITIQINNMMSHCSGKQHKERLVKRKQGAMMLQSVNCSLRKNDLSPDCQHFDNLKLKPRHYQTEVYEKSLRSDCVIFLPTGTGKTLVAAMIILKMLDENPHHRVAFLVDKVLLVMQQHNFLKEQFENIMLKRFDTDGSVRERKLRLVGLANSYMNTEDAVSVREHDIVVATAALFMGLLSDKKFFWNELGLVIFDEAHHCVKDHPYNKLLREYQLFPEFVLVDKTDIHAQLQNGVPAVYNDKLQDWKYRRCKMVGLTASPAGSLDKEMTHTLLLELLESMGGVDIVNVITNKEELDTFTSNSNIETRLVNYSENESNLRETLKSAFFFMLGKFERFITTSKNLMVMRDCRNLSVEDVAEFKSQLSNRLQETENIQKTTINHVMSILNIIDDVDTFGYAEALLQLKKLLDNDNEKVWLNENVIEFVPQSEAIIKQSCAEKSSVIQAIIDEVKYDGEAMRTILLLVRERETAHKFQKILKESCTDQELVLLVGHGAGSTKTKKDNKGMSVTKQKKALNLIKEGNNQIIVATSVADEGIDLPDCDLVILINPPSSVQALVQVRGRARKKNSRLLMICRDQKSIDELNLLKVKEKNIIESIEQILSGSNE